LPVRKVTSIIESKNGDIWFSTWGGGISRFNRSSFSQFTILDEIPRQTVQAITEDKNGNIWFGISEMG
jgi:streptogramin lyase